MLGLSPRQFMWVGICLSLLTTVQSGLEMSFNVYALLLKETFNYTQTQVEVVASMCTIGVSMGFLEAICTWCFGYKVTCLIIVIGSPVSSALFALAAFCNNVFHDRLSFVCFIQFFQACVNVIAYVGISRVGVEVLPKQHTGKVLGLYFALTAFGKIYFAGIMDLFFQNDLAGFFLFVSVTAAICFSACLAFMYPLATNEKLREQLISENDHADKITEDKQERTTPASVMLKSPFFQILFWTGSLVYGCSYVCMNNITAVVQSAGMKNPLTVVYVFSAFIVIVRLISGAAFDQSEARWCGYYQLLVSYISSISGFILCLVRLESSFVYPIVILIAIGMAPGILTPVSILVSVYGRPHYSAITGCYYGVVGISQIVLQLVIGFLYDYEVENSGATGHICYGSNCFFWAFTIMLVLVASVAFIQTINFVFFYETPKCETQ